MTKLQVNVSPEFAAFAESLVEERNKQTEQRVKSANQLIPLAIVALAALFVRDIPESIASEADEVLTRKPGPQKKKPIVSHDLFDSLPGTWISSVAIATGCAVVFCGEQSLSLTECTHMEVAALKAVNVGWGAIPESKKTSSDPDHPGLPGLRFIPPGASLAPKEAPATLAPMTLSNVGTWISEDSIFTRATIVLPDGRAVPFATPMSEQSFLIPQAVEPRVDAIPDDASEAFKIAHANAAKEARRQAVMQSIASAQIEAYELGWTMRREVRKGKPGILFVPPKVKLTYEIAHGKTVPMSQ
jgi:hypothetical protein